MVRENIYKSFEVFYENLDCCPLSNRRFNFFELVYVLSGEGKYIINGNTLKFRKGNLFLTTPNDCHEFNLDGNCEFIVARFNQEYIRNYQWNTVDHIECLLYNAPLLSDSLLQNKEDIKLVDSVMTNVLMLLNQASLYMEDILRNLINVTIVVAARNIAMIRPSLIDPNTDQRILEIINYIHSNILHPDLLRIKSISEIFGLSETYLGAYFRKQCGESIQDYISRYKIRLIEHRLQFSDKRITEIADEFGFTDESHINKFFKKHHNMTLKQFRTESQKQLK